MDAQVTDICQPLSVLSNYELKIFEKPSFYNLKPVWGYGELKTIATLFLKTV